jgi:large subunit ribosomal protein L25
MKSVSLNGIARVNLGKKFSKDLRKNGNIPCVIYSKGKEALHITVNNNDLRKIIYNPSVFVLNIKVDEKEYNTIIRDAQFHPISDNILHVDFLQLSENELVSLNIPVELTGNSIGVRNGGQLNLVMRKLLIKSLPKNLPDTIEIDITKLRIGQSIRIEDIKNENYNFVQPESAVVVSVKTARNVVEEEEEEEEGESEAEDKKEGESDSNEAKNDSQ